MASCSGAPDEVGSPYAGCEVRNLLELFQQDWEIKASMTERDPDLPSDCERSNRSALTSPRAMSDGLTSNDMKRRTDQATKLRADIANVIKSSLKRWFGRGPQVVRVDFSGTLVIVHCRGVLSKHEASVQSLADHHRYAEQLHSLHYDYFRRAKEAIASEIGTLIGWEVLGLYYEIDPALDESFFFARTSGESSGDDHSAATTSSVEGADSAPANNHVDEELPQTKET
jgi:uncharacterized protein YbcI